MKKKICFIFSLFLICLSFVSPVHAASTELHSVTINAYINKEGDIHIEETWDMDVHSGSEVYKVFDRMGDSEISGLKVKDDNGRVYKTIEDWDVDASKSEKDGKSGLVVTDEGYELCFGIGEYGKNTYTFEYDISHFVKQYTHNQGINYAFFSEMSLAPHKAKITLSSFYDFNKENTRIWAFGYHGDVTFQDGKIVMETNEQVPSEGKMQLLTRIEDNTFQNALPIHEDFDDVLKDAKEGSEYSDDEYRENNGYYNSFAYRENGFDFLAIIAIIIIVFSVLIGVILTVIHNMSKRESFVFEDHIPLKQGDDIIMFRDIPCHKDVFEFYYLAKKVGLIGQEERGGLISAILLRWIQRGYIEFEKREEKTLGVFKKDGFSIDFDKDIPVENPLEETMLRYFRQAAGDNKELETKEFDKWCESHYDKVDSWFESIDQYVLNKYQSEKLYRIEKTYSKVLGIKVTHDVDCFDASLRDKMEHVIGLKKFLEEMSLIDEKEVIEVKMWEEYLIYASVLGIADKVQEQLGRLCPTFNQQSELDTIYTVHMIHMFSYNSMRASYNASQMTSSGFGGGASFGGGGGGFSGGGGGGVR